MNYFFNKQGLPREAKRSGGFTLVELSVVITIAAIIMTTLVIKQSSWNDSLALKTQAYEMAMAIRQAQAYSLGVREDSASIGNKFDIGYGIYIDEDLPSNQYIFFADKNNVNKGIYDVGDTIIETKILGRGIVIEKFCGVSPIKCNTDVGPLNQVNITFFRPEPKANIGLWNNGGGNGGTNPPATIYLKSASGKTSSIKIEPNGQVSIIQ